jgi:hypothetical protein
MRPVLGRLLLLLGLASSLLQQDKACAPSETCVQNSDCIGFQREREIFLGLPNGSAGREAAKEALR